MAASWSACSEVEPVPTVMYVGRLEPGAPEEFESFGGVFDEEAPSDMVSLWYVSWWRVGV